MANEPAAGEVHVGHNVAALQRQLGVSDEALREVLGLSYNRLWDLKRRDWAQKKTVEAVAAALSELAGVEVTVEQVLTGRLRPEQFAARAVAAFVQRASELAGGPTDERPAGGGIRLPRLHLGALPAGPAQAFEAGDPTTVVRSDTGDFVVTADGDCMLPTIGDGDELVCVWTEQAASGELAVVSYADDNGEWQTGIKRIGREGERLLLICDNRSADSFGRRIYPDIRPAELRIHGLVVGLWRPLRRPAG